MNKIDIYFTDMQGNRLEGDFVMPTPNINTSGHYLLLRLQPKG